MRPLERSDPGNNQRFFVSVFDTFESQKDVYVHGLLLSNVQCRVLLTSICNVFIQFI